MIQRPASQNRKPTGDLADIQRSEGLRVTLMWAGFAAMVAIVVGLTLNFSGFESDDGQGQQASAPATSTAQ